MFLELSIYRFIYWWTQFIWNKIIQALTFRGFEWQCGDTFSIVQ